MTYKEFLELHTGAQFDFGELEKKFGKICEDYTDGIAVINLCFLSSFVGKGFMRLVLKAER